MKKDDAHDSNDSGWDDEVDDGDGLLGGVGNDGWHDGFGSDDVYEGVDGHLLKLFQG